MLRALIGLVAGTAALITGAGASATVTTYAGFADTAGLTFIGDATTATTGDGTVLRLTPAAPGSTGAAYSTSAIPLGPGNIFATTFQFRFTEDSDPPADGITFLLAAGTTGIGVSGEGLGVEGVSNSVAIEFDTYYNPPEDDGSNHVSVDTNGVLNDLALADVYGNQYCDNFSDYTRAGCMANGDKWTVTIGYDGTDLNVSVQDGDSPPQAVITNYAIDIASTLGTSNAYVGFTGATGSSYENQDILNWAFSNTSSTPPPVAGVPEPASLALLGAGLAALGVIRRRR